MTISKRLLITIAVALSALLILGSMALVQLHLAHLRFESTVTNIVQSVKRMDLATSALIEVRGQVTNHATSNKPAEQQDAEQNATAAFKKLDAALGEYRDFIADERDGQMLDEDKSKLAAYRASLDKFFAISREHAQPEVMHQLLTEGEVAQTAAAFRSALSKHMEYNFDLGYKTLEDDQHAYEQAQLQSGGLILGVFVLVAWMAFVLFHKVKDGLAGIRHTLQTVNTSLDFTLRADDSGKDEISQTANAFNALLARLQTNLKSILDGADKVALSSETLSASATQVATAAETQSSSSASMAATIEEMTVSINHVAERSEESRALAQSAGQMAKEGSHTIAQTIQDIREISRSVDSAAHSIRELDTYSAQVETVVAVIKDIADQTNLLALNAAIEAARAGEMGRGFAVVADEVRKLAERTSTSTQEISATINAMRDRSRQATEQMQGAEDLVRNGVQRADNADQAIRQIGQATSATEHMVTEISDAIKEQGIATNNIAAQVERIAQMTDRSATAAHEAAGSAMHLDELAREQMATLHGYTL